jgi:hypothetical protein
MCDEILSLCHAKRDDTTFLTSLATLVAEYEQQGCQLAAGLLPELSLEAPTESDDIPRYVALFFGDITSITAKPFIGLF